jgi:predicted kinase
MLIAFGGLPATGKTTIARDLARQIGAVFVRIDSIEHALRQSGRLAAGVEDAGYLAAYALAEDNLRVGLTVIADCVNPIQLTRDAWRAVAARAGTPIVEVEIICSDRVEHRRRVEGRGTDFPGWTLTWDEVTNREYHPWDRDHIVLDTSRTDAAEHVTRLRSFLGPRAT